MVYFMSFITFVCVFNLLLMGWITCKFGKEVFFGNNKESSKDMAIEHIH